MLEEMQNISNDSNTVPELATRNSVQVGMSVLFLSLTMLVALFGNTMVILIICKFNSFRRDIANMLIINLSITDLINTVLVMLSALVSMLADCWLFGAVWCDMVCAINYCLIIVSMLTLCFISIDRYQAVTQPLHYHCRVTRPRIGAAIVYAWCQGLVFASIPPLLHWVEFDYWEVICAIQWHRERLHAIYYVITAFALCFLGPGMILVYCYTKILKEVKRQRTCVAAYPLNMTNVEKKHLNTKTRMVWSLLIVVFAYFICTTPFSVTKLIKVASDDKHVIPGEVSMMAAQLGYFASAINPLIYVIFRKDFRKAYIRLGKSIFHRRHTRITAAQSMNNSLNGTFNSTN